MEVEAGFLRLLPLQRDGFVDVCLVDYARDDLPAARVHMLAVGRHDVGGGDSVGGAIVEEQGDKGAEGIDEEADDDEVDEDEDFRASPHRNIEVWFS